ncbi:MAG: HAD-IA family hydrolase [Peptococcaceae bacterium]|jgi:pyrophosphatase PpaX|nr:HAD-IA family hydrolase [Peptococcaceae bacterium]
MSFQTVLFDLDGTLIDSLPLIIECSRLAGAEIGLPWDEEHIRSMIGIPLIETGEILLGKGQGEFYRSIYLKYFHQLHDEKIKIFPDILPMLKTLKQQQITMAVVTSKIHDSAMMSLSETGIEDYFSVIITASEPCSHKPSPEPALLALERLGKPADHALFVGDSPYDIQCGKGAALATCGVTWGMATKDQLMAYQPTYFADTIDQLQEIILK